MAQKRQYSNVGASKAARQAAAKVSAIQNSSQNQTAQMTKKIFQLASSKRK